MLQLTDLSSLFAESTETDQLLPVYKELLADKSAGATLVKQLLESLAASPSALSEEKSRRQLANTMLLCGMLQIDDAYPVWISLLSAPEFSANISKQEWIFCELSRLLGTLSPADGLNQLLMLVLDAGTDAALREQYVMAMLFRWMADRDKDRDFLAVVSAMMARLPKERLNYELCMALIVNAVAAGGDSARDSVMDFFRRNEELFGDKMTEKTLGNFFSLGKQRTKNMLRNNYMGGYGEPQNEIERMLHYSAEAENDSAQSAPKTLPPIVRDKPKIGRNEPCPCGSGKKYKHCCGR